MTSRKLGAHLSIAGGYGRALERIRAIGGNCLQIFSASPRGWNQISVGQEQRRRFLELKHRLAIDPVYFHASYLINLADAGAIGQRSRQALTDELNLAPGLEIRGSIVHLGSYKNQVREPVLLDNIRTILKHTPTQSLLIIENAGNRKIGQDLDEIARIVHAVNDSRLRVCLDSCHLFSAGYDFTTPAKLDALLDQFDSKIGLDRLELWHLNDSRDPFHSMRDRHENIGQGTIGLKAFALLLNHPRLRSLPFIIETPGLDGHGPDQANLDVLKKLAC
ncbi:deoxyribonuclease IV [Patescibacteria group bacterium]|nr:deoxyribonuclease IV [Patescibacteria group bacterium]MCL5091640.1 deoxyribonuclease IV [Patescibacteria group bacterium]